MLGEFLKAARKRRRLTQRQLARRAGITSSYLSQIEHGCIPSHEVLQALAVALGLPAHFLVLLLYPEEAVGVEEVVLCAM